MAKLSETLVLRKRTTSKVNFGGHGDYLSEHDINLKYKEQPDVAKAIVKNARKMWDPVKELWLYEDVAYTSKFEDEECVEEDRRTHLDFEPRQAEPASSGPPTRASGKRDNTGADQPPAKKKNQGTLYKKLQNIVGQLAPVKLELQTYIVKATAGDMAKCIPLYVVSHANTLQRKVDLLWTQLQGYLAGEDCPDDAKVLDEVKATLVESASAVARLKVQLAEADNFFADSSSRASS